MNGVLWVELELTLQCFWCSHSPAPRAELAPPGPSFKPEAVLWPQGNVLIQPGAWGWKRSPEPGMNLTLSSHTDFLCSQPVCCPCLWVWSLNHKQRIDFYIPDVFLEQGNIESWILFYLIYPYQSTRGSHTFCKDILDKLFTGGENEKELERWKSELLRLRSYPFLAIWLCFLTYAWLSLKFETTSWAATCAACQYGLWATEKLVLAVALCWKAVHSPFKPSLSSINPKQLILLPVSYKAYSSCELIWLSLAVLI